MGILPPKQGRHWIARLFQWGIEAAPHEPATARGPHLVIVPAERRVTVVPYEGRIPVVRAEVRIVVVPR